MCHCEAVFPKQSRVLQDISCQKGIAKVPVGYAATPSWRSVPGKSKNGGSHAYLRSVQAMTSMYEMYGREYSNSFKVHLELTTCPDDFTGLVPMFLQSLICHPIWLAVVQRD